jgi:hypothetical protein
MRYLYKGQRAGIKRPLAISIKKKTKFEKNLKK